MSAVALNRPDTRETLARNLRLLMALHGWTQTQLSQKSGVSQRHISNVLTKTTGCSVEMADSLAEAFGLEGWHLILPNLPDDLVTSPSLRKLISAYVSADPAGRELLDRMAERERRVSNGR